MFRKAILVTFSFVISSIPLTAQEVRFKFELKDGLKYTERQRTVRNATVEGSTESQSRESDITTHYTVKKVQGGYDIVARTLAASMKRNGKNAADPVTGALSASEITMSVSDKGEFLRLKDADKLIAQVMQAVPAEVRPAMQKLLTVETLTARTANDWNARVPRFLNMAGEIGDAWTSTDSAPLLTGGQATFFTVTTLDRLTPCGVAQCVLIKMDYNTDPNELSSSFGEGVGKLLKEAGAKDIGLSDVKIIGKGEFVVNPNTAMLHFEKFERNMDMTITGREGPMRTHVVETRTSEFTYN